MKRKVKILLIIAMSLLLGALTVNAADAITISQEKVTVNIGDKLDLTVTGTDRIPTWTSYNANIAKVDKFGEVTALRKGKTKIRARVGLSSKLCTVTVVDSSIKLNKKDATIYHGGTSVNTIQLKATVKGASKSVTWESLNPNVATVNANGKVTSVSEGTAIITATANGKSASCHLTVKGTSISLNMDNLQVSTKGAGSSIKVTPTITGSKRNVKWATSDKTVATVSGGKVTGKKTGTATITATANGVSASCNVTVTEGLVSINEEKIYLYSDGLKADTKQLKTNAVKTDVLVWGSSDTDVATVDGKGLVTPVSAGTAIISVECGVKTDYCEVTVKQTVTNIIEDSVSLKTKGADKTYTLNKQIVGKTTGIKWATSDKTVATVSNGKVTAKKAGTATITATANGVSDTVTVNVADFDPTIKLNHPQYMLYTVKGNTVTLKATVDGASKAVTWTSSDTSVATVNKGKVTAVGTGTATISASANGVTAECIVDVTESAVVLDSYSISLDKGEKATIGYDVIGASQTVKWATSNSKIATVSKGVITAKNYGDTDIKVTANGVTSICHVKVVNCKHQYESIVTTQPTCGTEGVKTFTCALCGDTYAEVIPATGEHSYEWVVIKEAGCTEEGLQKYVCSVCSYSDDSKVIEALGHDFGEWETVIPATTTDEGMAKRTCNRCGESEKKEIPIIPDDHKHEYVSTVKEPTCTEKGYTLYTCSCGDSYMEDIVDALGHEFGEWDVVKEATVKEKGLKVRKCSRCGEVEEKEIPVISGDHKHEYSLTVKEPTCTEEGYTLYTCSCGDSYTDNVVKALGHDFTIWTIIQEATSEKTGLKTRICTRCKFEETEIIPVLTHEHDYVVTNTVAPTCTKDGYTEYRCSVCGELKQDDVIPSSGHNYVDTVVEPTCDNNGYTEHICSVCGDIWKDGFIPAKGHDYVYTVVEPTCISGGYTEGTCSVCGFVSSDDFKASLGHEASDWELIEDSCYGTVYEKYCIRCGNFMEQNRIDGPGHNYEMVITIEPNCQQKGLKQKKCTVCGDVAQEWELNGTHIYSEWETTKEPADGVHKTRSDFGTRTCHCTVCGKTIEESIVRIAIEDGQSTEVYGIFLDDEAKTTLDMVNNLRATEKNLKPYQWYEDYEDLCYIRAAELSYSYSHDRPGGGYRLGQLPDGSAQTLGENIARGYNTAEEAYNAWNLSSGHHKNMIDESSSNYCCKGFVIDNTDLCLHFWVQLFGGDRDEDDRYITTENGEDNSGVEGDAEKTDNVEEDELSYRDSVSELEESDIQ